MVSGLAVSLGVQLAILALGAGASWAQAPVQEGWWTVTNPGGVPASLTNSAIAPDVPSGGLLVEGGASATSPDAYAALVYPLERGTSAGILTLSVASGSATTSGSTLEVCPLVTSSIRAEQGGPMSDAPAYDCSKHVEATPASGSTSYVFTVTSLISSGVLALAILPTQVNDRVVLSQPSGSSLATGSGGTSSTVSAPSSVPGGAQPGISGQVTAGTPTASPDAGFSAGTTVTPASGAVAGAAVNGPVTGVASGAAPALSRLGSPTAGASVSAGGTSEAPTVTGSLTAGHSGALPGVLAAAGLILVLALWWGAGHMAGASGFGSEGASEGGADPSGGSDADPTKV